MRALLIGAGFMAKEYIKVFKACSIETLAICRSESSAAALSKDFDVICKSGGLTTISADELSSIDFAVVASSICSLKEVTLNLLEKGVRKILLEKPGAISLAEIREMELAALACQANIRIAYNRRFYPTLSKALELIAEDGGLRSFHIEISEWSRSFNDWKKEPIEKSFLGLTNSSHVIDMAFFSGGSPQTFSAFVNGQNQITWHPGGSLFHGAGVSERGIPFTYKGDWHGAGSWGLELESSERKILLCPLEKIFQRKKGTFSYEHIPFDLPTGLKVGVREMIEDFVNEDGFKLPDLKEQRKMFETVSRMMNY
jgi:hypothetical protein